MDRKNKETLILRKYNLIIEIITSFYRAVVNSVKFVEDVTPSTVRRHSTVEITTEDGPYS